MDTLKVPISIDATGESDVTAELCAFFASLPDGSTVQFPSMSKYRLDGSVRAATPEHEK